MSCHYVHCVRKAPFLVLATALMCSMCRRSLAFTTTQPLTRTQRSIAKSWPPSSSSTALPVWWFGGAESSEVNQGDESCELVAVRIDRTSPNSRRIAGSITVPTPLTDVWAILTDYDRLAIHVPNLVESKILSKPSRGEQGDGSYRCRLFQKGAQKIVGFEFGASVTMEMTEKILVGAAIEVPSDGARDQERMIGFKCVDSFFFTEFDGDWKAKEQVSQTTGEVETELTYVVDVRPKGPVPVAALEWRIREDVPTNLRAVKKAAMEVGLAGVLASRKRTSSSPITRRLVSSTSAASRKPVEATKRNGVRQPQPQTTNAIRRATVRRSSRSSPPPVSAARSSRRAEQPVVATRRANYKVKKTLPVAANAAKPRGNILQATRRIKQTASQTAKRAPVPFKVKWEADETMAAYLRE